eukprot:scpid103712/ scgid19792/ 
MSGSTSSGLANAWGAEGIVGVFCQSHSVLCTNSILARLDACYAVCVNASFPDQQSCGYLSQIFIIIFNPILVHDNFDKEMMHKHTVCGRHQAWHVQIQLYNGCSVFMHHFLVSCDYFVVVVVGCASCPGQDGCGHFVKLCRINCLVEMVGLYITS